MTRADGFIGRATEIARFEQALGDARLGTPTTLLVVGEAGIGKSRLTGEWMTRARDAGAHVLVGNCVQLYEVTVPYAPITEMLRTLVRTHGADDVRTRLGAGCAAVAELLPDLADGSARDPADDDRWGQQRLFEAILTLLGGLASAQPVMVVLEDLHWADQGTLDLVNFVVRNAAHEALIIVGTERAEIARDAPVRRWTAELLRVPTVERVDLRRFSRSEVIALLTALLGTAPDAHLADDVYRRSEGNAFFAEELVAAAREGAPDRLPRTLAETLLARVDALSTDAVHVLRTIAVGGGRVPDALLSLAVPLEPDRMLAALDEAVASHVLVTDGDAYAFRHAAFTEAVYASLLPGERVRLHSAYAEALEQRPDRAAHVAELAAHWQAAHHDERALAPMIEAARTARRLHAPQAATHLWERAVALFDVLDTRGAAPGIDRIEVWMSAADAANWSGNPARAITYIERARAAVDAAAQPHLAGRLQERLGWFRSRNGDEDGGLAAFEEALVLVPVDPPSAERAVALAAIGRVRTRRRELADARALCGEAVAVAVAAGARAEEGMARHLLGLALAASADPKAAVAELTQATSIALHSGDIIELAWGCVHLLAVGAQAHQLDDAVTAVLDLAATARREGLERIVAGLLECIAAGGLLDLGRWTEAERRLRAVADRGPSGLEVIALDIVRGTLSLRRGSYESAAEDLHAARAMTLGLRDGRMNGMVFDGLAELARLESRFDDARSTVVDGLESIENTGDDDMVVRLCLTGIRVEADAAEPPSGAPVVANPDAEAAAERLLAIAEHTVGDASNGSHSAEAHASLVTARAETARLRREASVAMWTEATDAWTAASFPYAEAMARLRLAEACFAAGQRDDAVAALHAARAVAAELGATPLVDRIDSLARRANATLGQESAASGVETPDMGSVAATSGLTPRERDVLDLVAAGRSNRQIGAELFISEKTASVHVSRILTKLGVASRGEAAAVARLRGLLR